MVAATKAPRIRVPRRALKGSSKPLTIHITEANIKAAKCKDPSQCVVAQAVRDVLGDFVEGVQVGSSTTKVYTKSDVVRFRTPKALAKAIPVFDKTGQWNLPVGEYRLGAWDTERRNNHQSLKGRPHKAKGKKKLGKFNGRTLGYTRSRIVLRTEALCNVR